MGPLSTLARDLVERRLWPVAAMLVVALIAVPVLFLRSTPAAVAPASAPAAPAPAASAAPAAPATPTTADPTADPAVALTSSPFAAAFGSGLSLPPSMEGLLKSTKGADDRKAVADAPLRDPFAAAAAATAAAASTASSSAAPAA